mgnify:CR=1 FL=1
MNDAEKVSPRDGQHTIALLRSDDAGRSVWSELAWPVEVQGQLYLSPQLAALSLRLRRSEPGYRTHWHVSHEPVLIVARRGVLRIGTRDGASRDFGPGDAFIAADALRDGEAFDEAVHVKLDGLPLATQ